MDTYYEDIYLSYLEKLWKPSHSDPKLYGLDDEFVKKANERYRKHLKETYEHKETMLFAQRVRWTDIVRRSSGCTRDYAISKFQEVQKELKKVQDKIRYLSVPKDKLKSLDIGTIKQVPIGDIFDVNNSGFFIKNPLREEQSPSNSLHWNKNKNTWTDYGTGEYGDIIDLVMKAKECDFKTACHIICP